jgi:hypothetical protein
LSGADLSDANLTQANCVGTDFTGANLNGACIRWNVDASTHLRASGASIYLCQQSAVGDRRRRPADKTRNSGRWSSNSARATTELDVVLRAFLNAEGAARHLRFQNRNPGVRVTKAVKRDGYLILGLTLPPGASEQQTERISAVHDAAAASGDQFNADHDEASVIDRRQRRLRGTARIHCRGFASVRPSGRPARETKPDSAGESRRVFVSYRRRTTILPNRWWRLEGWLQRVVRYNRLRPGRRWEDQIFDAIDSADCFIRRFAGLRDSDHTRGCQYVQSEINRAVDRGKKVITAYSSQRGCPTTCPGVTWSIFVARSTRPAKNCWLEFGRTKNRLQTRRAQAIQPHI